MANWRFTRNTRFTPKHPTHSIDPACNFIQKRFTSNMASYLYPELHDALTAPAQESQWAAWSEIRQAQRNAAKRDAFPSVQDACSSATGRALQQAEAALADATQNANQAALGAALDAAIFKQASSAWQTASQRADAFAQRVARARRAYEIQCAALGPASTPALVALTAFRQAFSDAHAASGVAARALEILDTARETAAASDLAAHRAAAAETAAKAARSHALAAEQTARTAGDAARPRNPLPLRSLQPCARLLDQPGLVSEVARSQGFCRSLASRSRSAP
jgi:hypothetical protein